MGFQLESRHAQAQGLGTLLEIDAALNGLLLE
jgi:hypothetical protein